MSPGMHEEGRTGTSSIPIKSRDGVESHSTVTSGDIRQGEIVGRDPCHPVHELYHKPKMSSNRQRLTRRPVNKVLGIQKYKNIPPKQYKKYLYRPTFQPLSTSPFFSGRIRARLRASVGRTFGQRASTGKMTNRRKRPAKPNPKYCTESASYNQYPSLLI